MSEKTPTVTDTIVKEVIRVQVGDETFALETFKFGKSLRLFRYIADLVASSGADEILLGAADDGFLSSFMSKLVVFIPRALQAGEPAVYRLLGLVVTPNKRLREMEEEEGFDVDKALYAKGRDLAWEGDAEQIMTLIQQATSVVGAEAIIKGLGPLMGMFRN